LLKGGLPDPKGKPPAGDERARSVEDETRNAKLNGFWFLVCYAATQLATQLRQRCIQVVRSNMEARKRLTKSNGTPAMDFGWE